MPIATSLPVPPNLDMCRRVAERAEQLGYESLWIADTGAGPDAFVVGAVAASVTKKVRLGTAVVPIYTRALPVMAAGAGSVAQLAPGRVVLGLGVSSETIVDTWGGVPFRRPLTRMRETVLALRQMLAGERVTVEGRTVRTRGFRLMSPPPAPVPIYVGALMPPMLELAGEIADGVILNFMPASAVPRMLEHVRIGAARAGRDASRIEVVARLQTAVTDDADGTVAADATDAGRAVRDGDGERLLVLVVPVTTAGEGDEDEHDATARVGAHASLLPSGRGSAQEATVSARAMEETKTRAIDDARPMESLMEWLLRNGCRAP